MVKTKSWRAEHTTDVDGRIGPVSFDLGASGAWTLIFGILNSTQWFSEKVIEIGWKEKKSMLKLYPNISYVMANCTFDRWCSVWVHQCCTTIATVHMRKLICCIQQDMGKQIQDQSKRVPLPAKEDEGFKQRPKGIKILIVVHILGLIVATIVTYVVKIEESSS